MKNCFYFKFIVPLTLSVVFSNSLAQDTIQGIAEQPLWFIPIYFEDGLQSKDTFYLGYDERADFFSNYDSLFSRFDTLIDGNFRSSYMVVNGKAASTRITEIGGDIGVDLSFINGIFPLKVSWDDSKLYTNLLPELNYPDLGIDTPRIKIYVESYGGNVLPFYNNNYSIFLSDSLNHDATTHFSDSVVIGEELSGSSIDNYTSLYFLVTARNVVQVPILHIDLNNEKIKVFPNPTQEWISYETDLHINHVNLLNSEGCLVKSINNAQSFNVSSLTNGNYFIQFVTEDYQYLYQFIKN